MFTIARRHAKLASRQRGAEGGGAGSRREVQTLRVLNLCALPLDSGRRN